MNLYCIVLTNLLFRVAKFVEGINILFLKLNSSFLVILLNKSKINKFYTKIKSRFLCAGLLIVHLLLDVESYMILKWWWLTQLKWINCNTAWISCLSEIYVPFSCMILWGLSAVSRSVLLESCNSST